MMLVPSAALVVGLALGGPAPAATPVPAPNPIAERFREFVSQVDPQVAATQEWLLIRAGRVTEDWGVVQANAAALTCKLPHSPDAFGALAAGLAGLGRLSEAVVALNTAVELQPTRVSAWIMLAQLQFVLGDVSAAAAALERVRALSPNDLGLLLTLAAAYARLEEFEKAAKTYELATFVAPENTQAWSGFATMSAKAGTLESVWLAYNQLRLRTPGVAAEVAAGLPEQFRAALPTPIPPTPRPTPRTDTPRLVMGTAPAAGQPGGGRPMGVWSETALNFESKIAAIALRGRPLTETMGRYEAMCRGARVVRSAAEGQAPTATGGAAGEGGGSSPSGTPIPYYDWATMTAKSEAWVQAAPNETMVECRSLAFEIQAEIKSVRDAVDQAVKQTAGTGLSELDRKRLLEKYGFVW